MPHACSQAAGVWWQEEYGRPPTAEECDFYLEGDSEVVHQGVVFIVAVAHLGLPDVERGALESFLRGGDLEIPLAELIGAGGPCEAAVAWQSKEQCFPALAPSAWEVCNGWKGNTLGTMEETLATATTLGEFFRERLLSACVYKGGEDGDNTSYFVQDLEFEDLDMEYGRHKHYDISVTEPGDIDMLPSDSEDSEADEAQDAAPEHHGGAAVAD